MFPRHLGAVVAVSCRAIDDSLAGYHPGKQIHQPHARLRVGNVVLFVYPNASLVPDPDARVIAGGTP
jgi:hypothetical protein